MESEKIYELLKEKIIWLDLMPESVLNLSDLARSFGVSRTPIKEVLILLQGEGWVLRQGSHFMVTPLSLDRIRGTAEIRSVMEIQGNISLLTSDLISQSTTGTESMRSLVTKSVTWSITLTFIWGGLFLTGIEKSEGSSSLKK